MEKSASAVFLLLIYFLVTFGYSFSLGFYHLPSFILLIIAFLLLSLFYFFPTLFKNFQVQNPQPIFTFAIILSIALSLVAYGGLYQAKGTLFNLSLLLLAVSLLLSLIYLFQPPNSPTSKSPISSNIFQYPLTLLLKYRFLIFLTIAFLLRLFMLISSPNPQIDVFDILKNGPRALTQGKNPYSMTFNKIYTDAPANYFAYTPGALVFTAPASILLDDPRFAMIMAEIGSAVLLFFILGSELIPILFLFSPRALFVIEQSWLDPLVSFLLILCFYLYMKSKKPNLASFIFGGIVTIKQSFIFLPLFLIKILKLDVKKWLWVGFSALLIILPFFLWNPTGFMDKVVNRYFVTVSERQALTHRSLTVYSFWFEQFQKDLPSALLVVFWVVLLVVILLKQKKGWSQFFLSTTLFYFGLFLFSNAAFLNFYYFIGQLLLINIALLQIKKDFS